MVNRLDPTTLPPPDRNRVVRKVPAGSASHRSNPFACRPSSERARIRRSLSLKLETRSAEKSPSDSQALLNHGTKATGSCRTQSYWQAPEHQSPLRNPGTLRSFATLREKSRPRLQRYIFQLAPPSDQNLQLPVHPFAR